MGGRGRRRAGRGDADGVGGGCAGAWRRAVRRDPAAPRSCGRRRRADRIVRAWGGGGVRARTAAGDGGAGQCVRACGVGLGRRADIPAGDDGRPLSHRGRCGLRRSRHRSRCGSAGLSAGVRRLADQRGGAAGAARANEWAARASGAGAVVGAVAAEAAGAGLDELGGACLRSDIAALRHETQETRLFRT